MAPRAMAKANAATPARGRGRPRKNGIVPTPVVVEDAPKKRGRPSKARKMANPESQEEKTVKTIGRRGRPPKSQKIATPATPLRASPRAKKTAAPVADAVIGSPRVTKTKARGRPKGSFKTAAPKSAARLTPALRSKLRDRGHMLETKMANNAASDAQAKSEPPRPRGRPKGALGRPRKDKVAAALPEKKKRGRPAGKTAGKTTAGKTTARKTTTGKTTARPVAQSAVTRRRARKGHVTMEVPKKFAALVQQTILDAQAAEEVQAEAELVAEADLENESVSEGADNDGAPTEDMQNDAQDGAQEDQAELEGNLDYIEEADNVEEVIETVQMEVQNGNLGVDKELQGIVDEAQDESGVFSGFGGPVSLAAPVPAVFMGSA